MPFDGAEVRYGLACGPGADGRWRGWFSIEVEAEALRRLGLHPDQPFSVVDGPSPPAWWHAAGERYATGRGRFRTALGPGCDDPAITATAHSRRRYLP